MPTTSLAGISLYTPRIEEVRREGKWEMGDFFARIDVLLVGANFPSVLSRLSGAYSCGCHLR